MTVRRNISRNFAILTLCKFLFNRIPSGTSKELRDLLMGLLKRNAADRFDFDIFFNHPFIRLVVEEAPTARVRTSPVKVPSADRGSRNTTPVATEAKCFEWIEIHLAHNYWCISCLKSIIIFWYLHVQRITSVLFDLEQVQTYMRNLTNYYMAIN